MVHPKFLLKYKISQNTFIPAHLLPQIPNQNANISNRLYIQTHESTKLHTHLHSQNPNFQTQTIKSTNLHQTKWEGYFGHRHKQRQGGELVQKKNRGGERTQLASTVKWRCKKEGGLEGSD